MSKKNYESDTNGTDPLDKIYSQNRVNSRLGSDSSGGDKSQMLINMQPVGF